MESTSTDIFLRDLKLEESHIDLFKKHKLDYELLKEMSKTDLKATFKEIGLPLGDQLRIIRALQKITSEGKLFLNKNMKYFVLLINIKIAFKDLNCL